MFEQNVTHGPGIGTLTSHTFEIITMLLGAFLLGLWLGWMLWSKYKSMIDKFRLDNESLNATLLDMKAENESLKTYKSQSENEHRLLNDKITSLLAENNDLKYSYSDVENRLETLEQDNMDLEGKLSVASSITPESASVPMEIVTSPFDVHVEDLVKSEEAVKEEEEKEVEEEEEAVEEEELPLFEVVQTPEGEVEAERFTTPADTQKITIVPVFTAPVNRIPDDLKVVEGIGPKIEEILHKNNIVTFAQLAATPVNRIKEVLVAEGTRFAMHDPGTWPAQALLASNNEWDNLKAYQTFLNAGKRPT